MPKKKHPQPSKKRRKRPESRFHLGDRGDWIVKMLLLPALTSFLCQYLVAWLEHWLKW